MKLMKTVRSFLKIFGGVLVASAILVGILWLAAMRARPSLDGQRDVAGLLAATTIDRDSHGIPLITAQSEDDAYFALGYAHAQDRFFQMEMMRRQGQGRLAEIIGRMGVENDVFMRTLGVYRRAEQDFQNLTPQTRRAFERYAAGVNTWLAEGHALPLELSILFFKPEPWRSADSLVWQKLMGLQLSGNWTQELSQAAFVAKLGAEKAAALMPDRKAGDPLTIPDQAMLYPSLNVENLVAAVGAVIQPTSASNAWVVAGTHTKSGKPIVANDPHLGFQSPSVWYFAGIDTPTLKLFGATVPGVPFHMLGHNHRVAWGITTPESDTSDLFIEQPTGDGLSYETPDGPKPFEQRTEVINVRFGDPHTISVRETRHGPVVSDIVDAADTERLGGNRVLALAAALLQPKDRTADGVYAMNRASDAASFVEAIRLFQAPQQNMMFADTGGVIGYYAPGRVPIRKAGDGTVPVEGWTGAFDWHGWIPFEELPHSIAPESGILVNANNRMVGETYPYLIAAHWHDAYRAARITELLQTNPGADINSTEDMQQDVTSLMAREMLPLLLKLVQPRTERHQKLLDLLAAWDSRMDRGRPEPLIFALWMEKLKKRLLEDELGDLFGEFGGTRAEVLRNVLTKDTVWCDDIRTPAIESCEQQVAGAWSDAMVWLDTQNVSDAADVSWGTYHQATLGHLLFQNFPALRKLGSPAIASSGDNYTINRGSFAPSTARRPFRHFHGATLRAIYDLGDLSRSRFALAGGQSGHITSPNYDDLLLPWRDGRYFQAPSAAGVPHQLTLQPRLPPRL
jgi:penicillin amidase